MEKQKSKLLTIKECAAKLQETYPGIYKSFDSAYVTMCRHIRENSVKTVTPQSARYRVMVLESEMDDFLSR